ncbi:signal peptidase I [Enterococcus sp. DIV0756]|uniref:signal peptidase I n=1 Tax=Enterococcus sp. DIV0756 TaxID=2774636 RepID=UPI003F24D519
MKKIVVFSIPVLVFLFSVLMVQTYKIHPVSGTSMEEKLHDGDHVLVNKRSAIKRYDVVGFSLDGESDLYVKRVIGMPGDQILVSHQTMIISLNKIGDFSTTYRVKLSKATAEKMKSMKQIPKNQYFLIGDHLDVSNDSRAFGLVSKSLIEGKTEIRLFPINRIGTIS